MDADLQSSGQNAGSPVAGAGLKLRRAREAAGKSLADISATIKVPERLLAAIEESRFAALPSRIYAIGFSRSYARAVGLDEVMIADEVRAEMDGAAREGDLAPVLAFTPGDPARVPGRRLALIAGLGAAIVIVAVLVFWRGAFDSSGSLPSILPAAARFAAGKPGLAHPGGQLAGANSATSSSTGPAMPRGAVTVTPLVPGIWVKIYEASGKTLFEGQMAQGQAFTVPADAQQPLIWTGRPEALAITIAGKPVAKLSEKQKTMKDVPISAAALLARPVLPLSAAPLPSSSPVAPAPAAKPSTAAQ